MTNTNLFQKGYLPKPTQKNHLSSRSGLVFAVLSGRDGGGETGSVGAGSSIRKGKLKRL